MVQKDPHTEILLQMSCGFTFASRRCTLTHTLFGVSCRDNFLVLFGDSHGTFAGYSLAASMASLVLLSWGDLLIGRQAFSMMLGFLLGSSQ